MGYSNTIPRLTRLSTRRCKTASKPHICWPAVWLFYRFGEKLTAWRLTGRLQQFQLWKHYRRGRTARLRLLGEFDAIINSSVVGAAKPERQIFWAALEALQARPTTTLYIDDSPGHVQSAAELGIISYVYTGYAAIEQL